MKECENNYPQIVPDCDLEHEFGHLSPRELLALRQETSAPVIARVAQLQMAALIYLVHEHREYTDWHDVYFTATNQKSDDYTFN